MSISRRRWTLRAKIIAWSFVPTAIILAGVALANFHAYDQVTGDLVLGRNRELTRLSAGQLATELRAYADPLVALARTADIYGDNPPAQRAALRRARDRLAIFDAGVLILNTFGTVVAAEPERPDTLGQDWSTRAYFGRVLHSTGSVFSDVTADGPQGAEAIVVAVPIVGSDGEFQGAMVGMFRLGATSVSAFYGSIGKLRVSGDGKAYLVDSKGRLIYHPDAERIGESIASQPILPQVLSGSVGAQRTRDLDGDEIVASYAPVPGTPWGLIVQEDWRTLIAPSHNYRRMLLGLLVLGVVVPAMVVAIGVRRITRPVIELTAAARAVAAGNFGQKITPSSGDELAELTEQFNLMSTELQEYYTQLERRVADRTRELATLNSIAGVVSRSLDLDEILQDALDKTLEVTKMEAGAAFRLEEDSQTLVLMAQRGLSEAFIRLAGRVSLSVATVQMVTSEEYPVVRRVADYPDGELRALLQEEGWRLTVNARLTARGRLLGVISLGTRTERLLTPEELSLLAAIGQQIGVAIETARLFGAEQRRAEQFRLIGEVGRRITSILVVDELLTEMARLARVSLGYYSVCIGLIEGDEVVVKAGAGPGWDVSTYQPPRLKVGREGIVGWVAQHGEPLLVPDVSQEPRYYFLPQASETRSELAVPLKAKDVVIGVLDVQSDRVGAFDESDLAVLQSLANQAAIAIENARLNERTQRRVAQLSALQRVSAAMASTLDPPSLLQLVAQAIQTAAGFGIATVSLTEGDPPMLRRVAAAGLEPSFFREIAGSTTPLARFQAVAHEEFRLGNSFYFPASKAHLWAEKLPSFQVMDNLEHWRPGMWHPNDMLITPLRDPSGNLVGIISVDKPYDGRAPTAETVEVLELLANQAAIAIENARLYRQAEESAAAAERNRLARDLHDAVTQTLFSASLIAEVLPRLWERNSEDARHRLSELRQLTRGALAEMRTLLLELRPATLAEASLGGLLRQLAEATTGRARVPVTVTLDGERRLPQDVQVALYRIAQEALNNVAKHSGATQSAVLLRCGLTHAELCVSDNGRGFDPGVLTPGHLGVGIMRERAQSIGAALRIESQPGHGTRIVVVWQDPEQRRQA